MAENQHRLISGYRELTQEEIDLMNEIKQFGPQLEDVCKKIDQYLYRQYVEMMMLKDNDANMRYTNATPDLWANEGRKSLQMGLMFLVRSVAQPTTF